MQDARLESLIDEAKAVACGNHLERQRHQQFTVGLFDPFEPGIGRPGEDGLHLGQIVLPDETETLEELMAWRQAAEQLDHGFGELVPGLEQIVAEPGLAQDVAHVVVARQVLDVEDPTPGRAEEQVFRQRRIAVVALGVELLDQPLHAGRGEPRAYRLAPAQHAVREPRVVRGVHRAAQSELEYGFLEFYGLQHLDDPQFHILRPGGARGLVVGPVGIEVERRAVGAPHLAQLELALLQRLALIRRLADGVMLQAIHQVFAHTGREEVGRGPDVGQRPAGDRLRRLGHVEAADFEPAAAWHHQAREHLRQLGNPRGMRAKDRDMLVEADVEEMWTRVCTSSCRIT